MPLPGLSHGSARDRVCTGGGGVLVQAKFFFAASTVPGYKSFMRRISASALLGLGTLALSGWLAPAGLAQPSINAGGVVNAASYAPPGLPNSAIAQGSLFVIFGRNLGPAQLVQATFPLQTSLAGTSVRVSVGGQNVDCYMVYTSATQVAALLPSRTPTGTGTITVTYNNQTSAPVPITVATTSFGVFTVSQAGIGPGVITDADYKPALITRPARRDQWMVLWGTGLGPVDFDETRPGNVVRDLRPADFQVLVGGRPAEVYFAGRSPQWPGLDQVNFKVPPGVEGCYVPLVVRARGVLSNFVSLPVSTREDRCSDPMSFSEDDFRFIGEGKEFRIGEIALTRIDIGLPPGLPISGYKSDDGSGSFLKYDFTRILRSRGVSAAAPFGQCTVYVFSGQQFDPSVDPASPVGLDAGPALNLTGPKGGKQLPRQQAGYYQANLGGGVPGTPGAQPEYLEPGTYTVDNGAGGTDVGPFTARLTIERPVTWDRNSVPDTVPRNSDLTIRWSGGTATEWVQIMGISTRSNPEVGAAFVCTERATAGSFTVPAWVLSALPESTPMSGMLMVGSSPLMERNKFNARGLDVGYFVYFSLTSKMVTYR